MRGAYISALTSPPTAPAGLDEAAPLGALGVEALSTALRKDRCEFAEGGVRALFSRGRIAPHPPG